MSISYEELKKYIDAYHDGHPLISDEEYDDLLEGYVKEHGESARPFNRQKQSDAVNDIVGTLPKKYGVLRPMREGKPTYKEWIEKKHLEGKNVCVQPKFDGCSVAVDFRSGRFFTRGDYEDGTSLDVTDLFKDRIDTFHRLEGTTAMKFEAIISNETYMGAHLYKQYLCARDAAQGILTSRDVERAKYIDLIPLRAYVRGEQYIPDYFGFFSTTAEKYSAIQTFIDQLLSDCASIQLNGSTYAVDGVVVSCMTSPDKEIPIYVDPNNEAAIKILELTDYTKLISIDFQFGKQGRITPVAIFEPIKFSGKTVDHATLSTIERVVQMELRHGDTIKIMYNIVPYFINSQHDGDYPIPVPKNCPICGAPLDYSSKKLVRCTNLDCRGLRLGSIIRFAEKMKMMGVSTGNITRLYDEGIVTSIVDLLNLTPNQFKDLPGFGEVSANNIVNSIQNQMYKCRPDRLLGALPINDTSERTWKCILDAMGNRAPELFQWIKDGTFVDNLIQLGYIKNVGELKLRRIIDGYMRHQDEIREIINIARTVHFDSTGKASKGRVCMTGTRDKVLTERLINEGYDVGGFSADCVAVIVPNFDFTSAKTEKAKELGIPIYDISMAENTLFEPF